MRRVIPFIVISLVFVAANAVAAAVMYGLILFARLFMQDDPLLFVLIGIVGIAASIAFLWIVIAPPPRLRALYLAAFRRAPTTSPDRYRAKSDS